jgi:predicted nucleic acid-binding protein
VRLVIADTSPVSYLIQIGAIDVLPALFERIALPQAVQAELLSPRAPSPVRKWIAAAPVWLEIHDTASMPQTAGLDEGETAAIALAEFLQADVLLIDERVGARVAREKGLRVTGTLGVLDIAAERGLVDFVQAIRKLKRTTFHRPEALLGTLIRKHSGPGDGQGPGCACCPNLQNVSFSASCRLRWSLACVLLIIPNRAPPNVVFDWPNHGVLKVLKASARNWRRRPSLG